MVVTISLGGCMVVYVIVSMCVYDDTCAARQI